MLKDNMIYVKALPTNMKTGKVAPLFSNLK
jgi:hypothetical protein